MAPVAPHFSDLPVHAIRGAHVAIFGLLVAIDAILRGARDLRPEVEVPDIAEGDAQPDPAEGSDRIGERVEMAHAALARQVLVDGYRIRGAVQHVAEVQIADVRRRDGENTIGLRVEVLLLVMSSTTRPNGLIVAVRLRLPPVVQLRGSSN